VFERTLEIELKKAGVISGFEFKWNPRKKVKFPTTFTNAYEAAEQVITRENFRGFVVI